MFSNIYTFLNFFVVFLSCVSCFVIQGILSEIVDGDSYKSF